MRIMFTLRLLRILMTIAYNHRLEFCKVENNAHTRERAAHWCAELQTVEKESFVATRRSDARHIFTGQSEAESVLHSECVSKKAETHRVGRETRSRPSTYHRGCV